jgi:hypothetical protein
MPFFNRGKTKFSVIAISVGAAFILAIIFASSTFYQNSDASKNAAPTQDPNDQFTMIRCDDVVPASSILKTSGFVMIKPRTSSATPDLTPSVPPTGNKSGIYEFVLKPGSKAAVTMSYDFCPGGISKSLVNTSGNKTTSAELKTFFESFNSTNKGIYKLNLDAISKSDNATNGPLGSLATNANQLPSTEYISKANGTGVKILPSNITKVSDQSIKVTYAIIAEPSAIKATYIITNFYGICPGEILTVGDEPNEKSAEWAKGPFYGCVG